MSDEIDLEELGFSLTGKADGDELTAVRAAVERYVQEATGGDGVNPWKLAGRLSAVGNQASLRNGSPETDPWKTSGRTDRL
ncbi:MAG: hypothetical protein ABEK59_00295 [Halobacteria archaeon]